MSMCYLNSMYGRMVMRGGDKMVLVPSRNDSQTTTVTWNDITENVWNHISTTIEQEGTLIREGYNAICPHCRKTYKGIAADFKFCTDCGEMLAVGGWDCDQCNDNTYRPADQLYCRKCGTRRRDIP